MMNLNLSSIEPRKNLDDEPQPVIVGAKENLDDERQPVIDRAKENLDEA